MGKNSQLRTKNTLHSFIWMMIFLIMTSVMPFIIRTFIINYMGIEYAGINSLFVSIMQVFSLTELGVGEALTFYLYKPIAENDIDRINKILFLYRRLYRLIACIILLVALITVPFLPYLAKINCPDDIKIEYIFFIYVLDTVLNYFVSSYCIALFQAKQSLHYAYIIRFIAWCFGYLIQTIAIIKLKNYYIYCIGILCCTIITCILDYILCRKKYPCYKPFGKIEKEFFPEFIKKILAVCIMKIRNVFRNSADSIIISSFLGLTILAKYNNYFLVMSIPILVTTYFRQAVLQGLGNCVAVESKAKNYAIVEQYSFAVQWVAVLFSTCLLCLYNPFMNLWVGSENSFPIITVILFCLYYYVKQLTDISEIIRSSTGQWKQGKWVAAVEVITNMVLNLILVGPLKEKGILIATIISIAFINIPFESYYVLKKYFSIGLIKQLGEYLKNALFGCVIAYICYYVTSNITINNKLIELFLYGFICFLIANLLLFLINIKNDKMWKALETIKKMLKR